MATFNIVAMGDGYGIVSSANVFATKDEAVAYVLKNCRARNLDRPAQGEEINDAQIACVGRRLAGALIRYARERSDDSTKKQVAALQAELCRVYRDQMLEEVEEA